MSKAEMRWQDKIRNLRERIQQTSDEFVRGKDMKIADVETVKYQDLSFQRFYNEYAVGRKPVIIRGAPVFTNGIPTIDDMVGSCGAARLLPLRYDPNNRVPGGIYNEGGKTEMNLKDFFSKYAKASQYKGKDVPVTELRQVANYNILNRCSALLGKHGFTIPKYFAQDFFQRVDKQLVSASDAGLITRDAHPTLFVAPNKAPIGLRVEINSMHLWRVQTVGTHFYRLFPNRHHLYPEKNFYHVDPMKPDYDMFPLMRDTPAFDAKLQPGDVLFIPADWVVYSEATSETSVEIGFSYVDGSNLDAALLHMWEGFEEKNVMLKSAMSHPKFPRDMNMDPRDISLQQYRNPTKTLKDLGFQRLDDTHFDEVVEKAAAGKEYYIFFHDGFDGDAALTSYFLGKLADEFNKREEVAFFGISTGNNKQLRTRLLIYSEQPTMCVVKNNSVSSFSVYSIIRTTTKKWRRVLNANVTTVNRQAATDDRARSAFIPLFPAKYGNWIRFKYWVHSTVHSCIGEYLAFDTDAMKALFEALGDEADHWKVHPYLYSFGLLSLFVTVWCLDVLVDWLSTNKEKRAAARKQKAQANTKKSQ
eukprot:TRINITY_DN66651_c3_g2_i1.p1 TRINITY_DN66651_c3_g2~~TRINITY_DN66651_c3_g2_i1.p1  ORF type:complete len:624 (+),score=79.90 TRINITY_DN66651_c3_g2_i1:114-1874(+)